jgi:hypothetical protein
VLPLREGTEKGDTWASPFSQWHLCAECLLCAEKMSKDGLSYWVLVRWSVLLSFSMVTCLGHLVPSRGPRGTSHGISVVRKLTFFSWNSWHRAWLPRGC